MFRFEYLNKIENELSTNRNVFNDTKCFILSLPFFSKNVQLQNRLQLHAFLGAYTVDKCKHVQTEA